MKAKKTLFERFWDKVLIGDGCWEWVAHKNNDGYGAIRYNRKMVKAHRLAWILTNGDIPEGLCVCHKCDNPACVRPGHLFLGTRKENMRDMAAKGRNYVPDVTGAKNPGAKLSVKQVQEIRARALAGETQAALGREFGLTQSGISNITRKNRWKHI